MNRKPIYKTPAGEQAIMAFYDRILVEWPDETESLQVQTRHGGTHVLALGARDAPALVLLHGAGSNALAWGGDMPELARHFRVYAVDTPGEPGRSCHERIPWKGEGIVRWLEDVLDGLGLATGAPVLLAGISQGGYVALRFATAKPERVEALVLLAPGGVSQPRIGFLIRAISCSLLGSRGADALIRSVLAGSKVHPTAVQYMKLIYTHFRSRMDPQPLLTDAELRGLTMPSLLLAGAKDALFDSAKTVARFEALVEGAEVRLLPDVGHAVVNVASLMVPFLTEAVASPAVA